MALLRRLVSRFQLARAAGDSRRRSEAELTRAVQRVLDLGAPVVCTLRDCRRELRGPVQTALAHIDRAVAAIPGPLPLAPDAWDRHPLLQALFTDAGEIGRLLSADRRLRSFFSRRPAPPRAFALLTAARCERTIFGTAVEGEIVRRDVAQTAVEFRDHRILDPAETPAETRGELRMRALAALVTPVVDRARRQRARLDELREQQRILAIQLKIQQSRPDRSAARGPQDIGGDAAPPVLEEIDRRIRELSAAAASPAEVLREMAAVLGAPQAALTVTPVALRLNWMGVKQCRTSSACDLDVRLVEVEIREHLKRTAVFVEIARPSPVAPGEK
jgi:hypothetical protein